MHYYNAPAREPNMTYPEKVFALNKLCNKYLHQLHEITFNKLTNDTL